MPEVVVGSIAQSSASILWTVNILEQAKYPLVTGFIIDMDKGFGTPRNNVIRKFLKEYPSATHLLFWDTDILAPPNSIKRLLSYKRPIISGLAVRKIPPYYPLMERKVDDGKYLPITEFSTDSVIKCDATGFGFMLINRDVLNAMTPPWCKYEDGGLSEDYYFCQQAQKLGYDIYVDGNTILSHVGDYAYNIHDSLRWIKENTTISP